MRILSAPDLHEPVIHPGGFDFIDSVAQAFQPDIVVFIGDVVDMHGVSAWTKHPNAPGPRDELEMMKQGVRRWHDAYPDSIVCIGNHDMRPQRIAAHAGIPEAYLKDYKELWETPRWEWVEDIVLGEGDQATYFTHGTGLGGTHPAFNLAKTMGMNSVMGHVHHCGGIKWLANAYKRWFGMDTGALIDDRLYAFAYGKPCKKKTVLGCGVIDTENPMETRFIAMPCGRGEMFDRDKYPMNPMLKGRLA